MVTSVLTSHAGLIRLRRWSGIAAIWVVVKSGRRRRIVDIRVLILIMTSKWEGRRFVL